MTEVTNPEIQSQPPARNVKFHWLWLAALFVIFAAGLYFRLVGIDWDKNQHLHPDERFLTMVASAIQPVENLADYFNTDQSSMNPHNVGYGFYVYGTLPLFLVRFVAEYSRQLGYDEIHLVGRFLSAVFDLLTVLLVFLTSLRLYKKLGLSVLAAAFSALSVLQIQLSHYFTVDTFANFFSFLAFYFATWIFTGKPTRIEPTSVLDPSAESDNQITPSTNSEESSWKYLNHAWNTVVPFVLFGIALGMAMASKISAAPVAVLLPAAALIYYLRLDSEQKKYQAVPILRNLVIAGITALIIFRICQPYAFADLGLNPRWLDNMKELSGQSSGDVDFPPALQWARRSITFAWENLVNWGLGLPLGLLAWTGFIWMAWRMIKGELRQHVLLWAWTGAYFVWQSINFTRSMRYQLPIYPSLAIIAAWAIYSLWASGKWRSSKSWLVANVNRVLAVFVGSGVLLGTLGYAIAFSQIYIRPVTRIAASEWIYQNVPAPINLKLETATGIRTQPLHFRHGFSVSARNPAIFIVQAQQSGSFVDVIFEHVVDQENNDLPETLIVRMLDPRSGESLSYALMVATFMEEGDPRGKEYKLMLDYPVFLESGQTVQLNIETANDVPLKLAGSIQLGVVTPRGMDYQSLPDPVEALQAGQIFTDSFTAVYTGRLTSTDFPYMVDWQQTLGEKLLRFGIYQEVDGILLAEADVRGAFAAEGDIRGKSYTIEFPQPVLIQAGERYVYQLEFVEGSGQIAIYGSKHANESSWDDVLPLNLHGYEPYDYDTGLYRTDLNFEMYWDDNTEKYQRFIKNLDMSDYLFISSNRQWGTTTRVPERYPLTTAFYRNLLGCPNEKEVFWCYAVAQPGMFAGRLGFDLVYVNQSDPTLGPLRFNSQFAEEAFTVYDAPKVMVFKKTNHYDPAVVRTILGAVDLSQVIHLTPRQASNFPGNLMLSPERLKTERAGGTWSDLFDRSALFNQYPVLALILWYLTASLLGWMVYPFVRLSLSGLADKGYPLARLVGFALLAYFTWLAGSLGVPVTKLTISMVLLFLLLVNGILFFVQRKNIQQEIKDHWRYFAAIEILTLAFFTFFFLIRLGNPDLWHPSKGGEKPMDFSYFNAVLKSTNFPPYDPWLAGGYLNYYYYGFVLSGMLVKWLGIVPSIAYNLILPTWFSLLGMAAFSVGWNLVAGIRGRNESEDSLEEENGVANQAKGRFAGIRQFIRENRWPLLAGLVSALILLVLGNLGTLRMIWHGWIKLAAPNLDEYSLTVWQHWSLSFQGFAKWLVGERFPYPQGDWYWIPSRVYPNEPITEFPFFTFLYADPHAHLFALPVTVLAVAWAVSILHGRWQWAKEGKGWLVFACSFLLGGLTIGALWPTNTWDFPTYLAIGLVAVLYTGGKYAQPFPHWNKAPLLIRRLLAPLGAVLILIVLSFTLYQPYFRWYGQGYNAVIPWEGDHSPFWSYITHWGLFLFIIISWMVWETRDWMANTPVSALGKLKPYRGLMIVLIVLLLCAVVALLIKEVSIAWLVLPLATWAAVLIFRPGQSDARRAVLFFTGTALILTLAVELVVLRGDIGRMNTVFKFYLQAWCLFALSAGAAFIWLLPVVRSQWLPGWRIGWQVCLAFLVFSASLFTFLAGADKIRDRMSHAAPHSIDGMAYMATSTYSDVGRDMDLNQDYLAIQWMQENVQGSPVIVEANTVEYRWGSRYTIYTGLPGVVGWNWHQRQQRAITPSEWVTRRVDEIGDFYRTDNRQLAEDFLRKYDVSYIVVGQLERAYFEGSGMEKFPSWNGDLWNEVYRDRQTVIYQVNP